MTSAFTLHILRLAALLMLAVGAGSARAVVYTVGADAPCTHASIQAAFSAIPAGDDHVVRIANNMVYNAQALALVDKHVTVIGGVDDCSDTTPSGVTRLSGAGGGPDSVLTITGTNNDVILEHLSLVQGDEVYDGFGGGIDFRASGYLTLRDTSVSQNYAGYGGGIHVSATGGSAELRIESGSVIFFNSAQFSGGGVRLLGDARLVMLDANTQISDNEAIGIDPQDNQPHSAVLAAASNWSGTPRPTSVRPGLGGYGAIYNNRARHGGGIAVTGAGSSTNGRSRGLFSTDPARPVRIQNNTASQSGGGIYVRPGWYVFTVVFRSPPCAPGISASTATRPRKARPSMPTLPPTPRDQSWAATCSSIWRPPTSCAATRLRDRWPAPRARSATRSTAISRAASTARPPPAPPC